MHARAPVYASRSQVAAAKAAGRPLIIKLNRGGVGRMSGNGPSGHKATPRALLAKALRERAGVAAAVTKRQAAAVETKKRPPTIIYGKVKNA